MSQPEATTVYTIGHGLRPLDAVADDLAAHDVDLLVDVRSVPYSRRNPEFTKARLTAQCGPLGLGYRWLGDKLGGRPEGLPEGAAIGSTAAFAAGLVELDGLAGAATIALLCAEADPAGCHRSTAIAPRLEAAGYRVVHILPGGDAVPHQPTLPAGG